MSSAEDAISRVEAGGGGREEDGAGEFEAEDERGFDEGAVVLVFAACLVEVSGCTLGVGALSFEV